MGFEYTVLPDGSILKLTCPADFVCAARISQEEIGDLIDGDNGNGGLQCALVSASASD